LNYLAHSFEKNEIVSAVFFILAIKIAYMRQLLLTTAALVTINSLSAQKKLTEYVNPFIGTAAHGHTYPGATIPFGMVQLSPDNGTAGWDWSSGYHYSDSMIAGFSHTHLSGTGIGDLTDISVLPIVNRPIDTSTIRSSFAHDQEMASPGFYQVRLKTFDIDASFTTSIRCGFHKYVFPASNSAAIRINLGFAVNWDKPTECYIKQVDDTTFVGYRFSEGWAKKQKVYFALRTTKTVRELTCFVDGKAQNSREYKGKNVLAFLQFSTKKDERVLMKVGISTADIEGALASLDEIKDWNFDAAKESAANIWERELRKVQIRTENEALKTSFYTALYHTYLAPVIFTDRYGNYKNTKGETDHAQQTLFTVHSLWDTYRAANPLLTITQTELVPKIINSYLSFYKSHGLLPVWDLQFHETNTMTGYHCIPVVADAILKNMKGFNYEFAYEAMKKSAMQDIRGTDAYRKYGYLPYTTRGESVTITLEYAYDDWCIAQVAKKLGKQDDYKEFTKRAASYKPLFDKSTGFFRGKDSVGNFITRFDPYELQHDGEQSEYTEGNAWQHSFYVPHDVRGLAKLHGNKELLIAKLDSLFTTPFPTKGFVLDVSGLIGQYAHGNEPSHHIAYMYSALGEPAKCADWVRKICQTMYSDKADGLCGNEDCGQMSAWYVFSVLGMYPMNPTSGEFVFGSPLMDEAVLQLPDSKLLRIVVNKNSDKNKYIQSIKLNGEAYSNVYLKYNDLMRGGTLEIEMGDSPSAKFGKDVTDWPYSMTK
jgi:predicted alpha-1,2-mannosidase